MLVDQAVYYFGFCRKGLCGVDDDGNAVADSPDDFVSDWRRLNLPFHQTLLRTVQSAEDAAFVVTVKNEVHALGENAAGRLCATSPAEISEMREIPLSNINGAHAGPRTTFFQSGAQLYICGSNFYAGDEMRITASQSDELYVPYALSDIRGQLRDVGVFRTGGGEALFVIAENGSVLVRGQIDLSAFGCGDQVLSYERWTLLAAETAYNEVVVGPDSVTFTYNPHH